MICVCLFIYIFIYLSSNTFCMFCQMSLPLPVMLPSSPTLDEDKYTNPELFSNPGSHSDDLQAVDDRFPAGGDAGSEVSSDNFYLPPLPPERGEGQGDLAASLNMLQGLMGTSAPNLLQQVRAVCSMLEATRYLTHLNHDQTLPDCTQFKANINS